MGALESGPQLDPATVAQWVQAARDGDQNAWRLLVRAYSPRVYALAKSRLRRSDAAEEVTQSVFATIAQHIISDTYDEQHKFEPWLFRIAINRIRDVIRQAAREASPTRLRLAAREAVIDDTSHDALETDADLALLREALEQLSPPDRELIELRYHGSMGFAHMASLLDEPYGTLLARHHRALRKLKTIIQTLQSEQHSKHHMTQSGLQHHQHQPQHTTPLAGENT